MSTTASPRDSRKRLRLLGRLLVLVWAAFWLWFGIASSVGERESVGGTLAHILPGLGFLIVGVLAFAWQIKAAILLVAMGLAVGILYPLYATNMPLMTIVFMEMTMALPPLVAGILLLFGRRKPVVTPPPPSVPSTL